eukprot:TRINITY_DN22237_c0_g1_i1.p1 TRINITY_DN22237_c0_g1~~TRINITY_DN22237_c0_g1_i1.p1  ORF type:complete len:521 (-),score=127.18 TRINITY_DN22237_c0_g1_i1:4-1566(-)
MAFSALPHQLPAYGTTLAGRPPWQLNGGNGRRRGEQARRAASPCVCQSDQRNNNVIYIVNNSRKKNRPSDMDEMYFDPPPISSTPTPAMRAGTGHPVWLYTDPMPSQNGRGRAPYAEPTVTKSENPALNNLQSQLEKRKGALDRALQATASEVSSTLKMSHDPLPISKNSRDSPTVSETLKTKVLEKKEGLKTAIAAAKEEEEKVVANSISAVEAMAKKLEAKSSPPPPPAPPAPAAAPKKESAFSTFSAEPLPSSRGLADDEPRLMTTIRRHHSKPSHFVDQEPVLPSWVQPPVRSLREKIATSKPAEGVPDLLPLKERESVAAELGLALEREIKKQEQALEEVLQPVEDKLPVPAEKEEIPIVAKNEALLSVVDKEKEPETLKVPVPALLPAVNKEKQPEMLKVPVPVLLPVVEKEKEPEVLKEPVPAPTKFEEPLLRQHHTSRVSEGDVVTGAAIAAGALLVAPYTVKPVAGIVITPLLQVVGTLFTVYFSVTTLLPSASRQEFQGKLKELRGKIFD